MRMSKLYMPTLREDPAHAEIASHRLLLRAGMIRSSVSGLYNYLPLGFRVVRKVEQVVREGMDSYGAQEVQLTTVQPREIWDASGRWDTLGPEMFKVVDRNGREYALSPTAEEYFTQLIKGELISYKDLPTNLYQIQTKYRDEKRPRFGINRSREFLMKDGYSFDLDEEMMKESYDNMWRAYEDIFDRLELEYKIVQGDSGAMGGDYSHEFVALSETGEGVIYFSDEYAATDEKAKVHLEIDDSSVEMLEMEEVETPGCTTIEQVSEFTGVNMRHCVKAIDLMVAGEPVIVFVPGDRELNMAKLVGFIGVPEHEIRMMEEFEIEEMGSFAGYTGPVGLDSNKVRIILDESVTKMRNVLVGANKFDYHIKNVNYDRDFDGEIAKDLLEVEEGDFCPETGKVFETARGIEVGNIFQLGKAYAEYADAKFLDENGRELYFHMGCYGIGVTRSVSAIVEQNHDEYGIIWPLVVAPYHVVITVINTKNEEQMKLAEEIYETLQKEKVEVLLDDREDRAGVKFADRDLIGIPLRITVGRDASDRVVEFSTRKEMENENLSVDEVVENILEATKDYR